ncbi:mCG1050908 [Mus musculus]|nr:mCG1050908 [Mus musculus]
MQDINFCSQEGNIRTSPPLAEIASADGAC